MKPLKGYFINLDYATDRLAHFLKETNANPIFTRFNAINGQQTPDIANLFNFEKAHQMYGRPISLGEAGCSLSHYGVYQLMVEDASLEEQDFVLVAEDDITLCEDWAKKVETLVAQFRENPTVDLISMQHYQVADFEAYNTQRFTFSSSFQIPESNISVYRNFMEKTCGAAFYFIRKSGARKIIDFAKKEGVFWLGDDFSLLLGYEKILYTNPCLCVVSQSIPSHLEQERISAHKDLFKKPDDTTWPRLSVSIEQQEILNQQDFGHLSKKAPFFHHYMVSAHPLNPEREYFFKSINQYDFQHNRNECYRKILADNAIKQEDWVMIISEESSLLAHKLRLIMKLQDILVKKYENPEEHRLIFFDNRPDFGWEAIFRKLIYSDYLLRRIRKVNLRELERSLCYMMRKSTMQQLVDKNKTAIKPMLINLGGGLGEWRRTRREKNQKNKN